MQFLVYILVYPLLYLVSLLPFRLLYILSDAAFFFMYHIVRYRRKVVFANLALSFPEKSATEIKIIQRKFYKHFCDQLFELIKMISASKETILDRFQVKNPEVLNRLEDSNPNVIMMLGHYGNFEWSLVISEFIRYNGYTIYRRIDNIYFDRLAHKVRSRFGVSLMPRARAIGKIRELCASDENNIIAFISDQSPRISDPYPKAEFMGVRVPTYTGAEIIARKFDLPVCYLRIEKASRGRYEAEFNILTEKPNDLPDFQITEKFYKSLEEQIRKSPEFYLWTHKRWKHREMNEVKKDD